MILLSIQTFFEHEYIPEFSLFVLFKAGGYLIELPFSDLVITYSMSMDSTTNDVANICLDNFGFSSAI